jgi:hypothetical protein
MKTKQALKPAMHPSKKHGVQKHLGTALGVHRPSRTSRRAKGQESTWHNWLMEKDVF